jgi:hypothetical protein
MANANKPKSGGGCFSKIVLLVLLVLTVGSITAVYYIAQAQDLSKIGGYTASNTPAAPVREMKIVLKNAIDRGYPLKLTEAEINQWLASTIVSKQGGLLASRTTLEHVCVRLEDGIAELIIERKLFGRSFTVSMFLQIEQTEGAKGISTEVKLHGGEFFKEFPKLLRGGRFGQLLMPQGFLILVMPAYEKIAALFPEEIHLGFEEMSRIKITKGYLELDPRPNSAADPLLPKSF